MAMAIAEDRS